MDGIIAQGIGFVAMALCIGSYQMKTGRGLILCKMAGDIVYIVHFLMLGAYSGCVTLAVSSLNALVYSQQEKHAWAGWKGWRWFFCLLLIAACTLTWQPTFPLFPNLCSVVSITSVIWVTWSGSGNMIRYGKLFVAGPTWILYALAARSWSGVLCELFGMCSAMVAIFRYRAVRTAASQNE